ncbi:MAG: hypothetical protein B1H04_06805, partial [Planctomycetales bacterium 4484_123]
SRRYQAGEGTGEPLPTTPAPSPAVSEEPQAAEEQPRQPQPPETPDHLARLLRAKRRARGQKEEEDANE